MCGCENAAISTKQPLNPEIADYLSRIELLISVDRFCRNATGFRCCVFNGRWRTGAIVSESQLVPQRVDVLGKSPSVLVECDDLSGLGPHRMFVDQQRDELDLRSSELGNLTKVFVDADLLAELETSIQINPN
jgi:hypothetical protein